MQVPQQQIAFLDDVSLTRVAIPFEALTEVALPPFPGPTIRGILGHALLEQWCKSRPLCSEMCGQPSKCLFYERFAQDRQSAGGGRELEFATTGGYSFRPVQAVSPARAFNRAVLADPGVSKPKLLFVSRAVWA